MQKQHVLSQFEQGHQYAKVKAYEPLENKGNNVRVFNKGEEFNINNVEILTIQNGDLQIISKPVKP